MLKKIGIGVGILVIIFLIGVGWAVYYFSPDADRVLQFIKNKPNKSAIHIVHNGQILASQHADTIMPLASTVKTIIAIEFAYQVAAGSIDTAEWVDTLELDKYYIPETDGGAHQKWLDENRGKQVNIIDVARGMIQFSSNANTEYLLDRLSLSKVNNRLDSLGLAGHQAIYPIVSALFVCQNTTRKDHKEFLNDLRAMPQDEYIRKCNEIHEKLKHNASYKSTFNALDVDTKVQEIWSRRLPGGSCNMYAGLMQKLNSRTYFPDSVQGILNMLMEKLMQNPKNAKWLKHAGRKGGSTITVLTETLYATDKKNNTTELAVFFNNLSQMENLKLQFSINEFSLKLVSDSAFREKVKTTFIP